MIDIADYIHRKEDRIILTPFAFLASLRLCENHFSTKPPLFPISHSSLYKIPLVLLSAN